jgi:manganese efflux pump family protein
VSFGAIFLLSLGLAMDATAVAAARGLAAQHVRLAQVVLVGLLFGSFQALMPLLGWFVGSRIGPAVQSYDHWIAFGMLAAIGGKMLFEAFEWTGKPPESARPKEDLFRIGVLLVLALATSIDALAVGVTLPMLGAPLLLSLTTIGITTAALSAGGLVVGRRFGALFGKRLDILGGLVLIGLGTKILIEHLMAP